MNVNKTKHVIIWNTKKELSRKININIKERRELEKVTMVKYTLGSCDRSIEHLLFKKYCDYLLKKVGKETSFLNRIGNQLSVYVRCVVYKAIAAPHFEYRATIINMRETETRE